MKPFNLNFNSIFAILFLMFSVSSCSLVEIEKPWEIKNKMLEGEWDPVTYRINGDDYSSILQNLTFVFTPSEAVPKQGKYETFKKNKKKLFRNMKYQKMERSYLLTISNTTSM